MPEEHVVLVTEENEVVGTMPKRLVHSADTPLHRGVSLFVFNDRGEVLTQRRAAGKRISPNVWTDSCSAHPMPGESNVDSAIRRAKEELGIVVDNVQEVSPYRYYVDHEGVLENELCPILIGRFAGGELVFKAEEVSDAKWVNWKKFVAHIRENPSLYSPWCVEEIKILENLSTGISGWYNLEASQFINH